MYDPGQDDGVVPDDGSRRRRTGCPDKVSDEVPDGRRPGSGPRCRAPGPDPSPPDPDPDPDKDTDEGDKGTGYRFRQTTIRYRYDDERRKVQEEGVQEG